MKYPKEYNYGETLKIVENFMIESGIRDHCSNICKGWCCRDCYTSVRACYKNEGRRLPCSVYICSQLTSKILSRSATRKFLDCFQAVVKAYKQIEPNTSPYFDPPKNYNAIVKDFKIKTTDIEFFEDVKLIESIKKNIKTSLGKLKNRGGKQ